MPCSELPEYDIEIHRGDDKEVRFKYKADDVPVDISGYTIVLECTDSSLNRTAIIEPDQVLDVGEYKFVYVPADTVSSETIRANYEVVFYPTGLAGVRNTKYKGSILISAEIT